MVVFDPTKPITQDFVRVLVRFNVAKPLRVGKVLSIGGGKTQTIHSDYEKLHKRCWICKRLNHEKNICPLEVRKRQDEAQIRRGKVIPEKNIVRILWFRMILYLESWKKNKWGQIHSQRDPRLLKKFWRG